MTVDDTSSTADAESIAQGSDDAVDPDAIEPAHTVIGVVPQSGSDDDIVESLVAAGIESDRIRRLSGEAGVTALDSGGGGIVEALGKLLSEGTEFRDEFIAAIEAGRCVVMVTEVGDDDGHDIRSTMQDVGLEQVHFFGSWVVE